MNYRDCYEKGRTILRTAGIEEADWDARLLLEHICGTGRNDLLVHGDRLVEAEKEAEYFKLLEKRRQRIPLQQITGVQEFMGLTFQVNEYVLIPRQDTEILVEEVLKNLPVGAHILDMCTGSGCILLSLLKYGRSCTGVGVDISEEALKVANRNGERLLGADEALQGKEVFSFIQGNLFERVNGKYEIIVSNPPYIRSDVILTLMPEVREHEPLLALDGAEDGLFFYRKIVDESRDYLTDGGRLYFEIGYDQAEEVCGLMRSAGFAEIKVVKDYAGLDRVVYGSLGAVKKDIRERG